MFQLDDLVSSADSNTDYSAGPSYSDYGSSDGYSNDDDSFGDSGASRVKVRGIARSETQKVEIAWRNIHLSVPIRKNKGTEKLKILKGVDGKLKPGTMTALLGASGAGKTTLLNVISGRTVGAHELKGEITLNGEVSSARAFREVSSFVTQDDILPNALSAREIFGFTADLRLPGRSSAEKKAVVERLLVDLGIDHRADVIIGEPGLVRGISGGERKRVNIGNSLVTDPSVLFLDEPTTGLDSHTAHEVVGLLRAIADSGKTILSTIHQPDFETLEHFDQVMVLAQGRIVYSGPPGDIVDYFAELGHKMDEYDNPADFVLKLVSVIPDSDDESDGYSATDASYDESVADDSRRARGLRRDSLDASSMSSASSSSASSSSTSSSSSLSSQQQQQPAGPPPDPATQRAQKRVERLIDEYDRQKEPVKLGSSLAPIAPRSTGSGAQPFPVQAWILFHRAVLLFLRNPLVTFIKVIEAVIVGLFSGFVFYQVEDDQIGATERQGILFVIVVQSLVAALISVLYTVPSELPLFFRERSEGSYGTPAYALSKVMVEILPMTLNVCLLTTIVYWLAGLKSDAGIFFVFLLTMTFTALAAAAIGNLISSATGDVAVSVAVAPATIPIMLMFSGYLRNLQDMTKVVSWIRFINPMKYSYAAVFLNEFRHTEFYCKPGQTFNGTCPITDGQQIIDMRDIDTDSTKVAFNIGLLAVLWVALRILGALVLAGKCRSRVPK